MRRMVALGAGMTFDEHRRADQNAQEIMSRLLLKS
jgi:hypothetical protein